MRRVSHVYCKCRRTVLKEDQWHVIKRGKKEEHAGGLLSFVGGKADHEGNSKDILERTLTRELYEEVGVVI
jgi:8-oxo-dGTP diphosphatase